MRPLSLEGAGKRGGRSREVYSHVLSDEGWLFVVCGGAVLARPAVGVTTPTAATPETIMPHMLKP